MLIKANEDIHDYGPFKRILKGSQYIVVAIEKFDNHDDFYVVNIDKIDLSSENDPLAFDSKYFDILDTKHTDEWVTQSPEHTLSRSITSFKDWFENGFYYRAHDWDLNEDDHKILNNYLTKYLRQSEDD